MTADEIAGRQSVSFAGDVDLATAQQLRELLLEAVDAGNGDIALDMGQVRFLDSTGIGVLVHVNNRLADGRRLIIRNPTVNVRQVLELTAVDNVLVIEHDSADGANSATDGATRQGSSATPPAS